ncbi:MAG: BlaI/MecI/CopY family transcriptional regulator [Simkaniaceae bacterium]|nr:MAG: BlaI/MecI/CopY family transcriptional regulator [Simkaniaceae bacterium]
MNTKRSFGELETVILRLFMKEERALSVNDVVACLGGKNAYTTIMTVMSRLFEKGVLKRSKKGRSYFYSIKKAPLLKRLKSKLMGAKPSEVFSYFLEEKIDPNELEAIEKMIKDYKEKWNS